MNYLLTSAGVQNPSIRSALLRLLGKPMGECGALCITTGSYATGSFGRAWDFVSGNSPLPMCDLGWKSMGILELTVLPTIDRKYWVQNVEDADVILVNGGDPLYLSHWMKESGFAGILPTLKKTVYVGLSAGSMVLTRKIGREFVGWNPQTMRDAESHEAVDDRTLGIFNFSIFPHLDHPNLSENTSAHAEKWAANIGGPAYAIDDETAIQVIDGKIEVITEGKWKSFRL